MTKVAFSI